MSKKIFDDPAQQLFKPRGRLLFLQYFFLVFFIILGVRFWFLQVVQHDHYVKAAENNRVRDIPIRPLAAPSSIAKGACWSIAAPPIRLCSIRRIWLIARRRSISS